MTSKKYRLSRILFILSVLLMLSCAERIAAQTDETQKITLEAQQGKGKRDKNIKPGKTRRPITGNTVCNIEIKNNTAQFVSIYIDGILYGTTPANTSFKTAANIGRRKIYVRTNRINNSFLYWGPNYFTCGSAQKDGSVFLKINPAKTL